MVNEKRYNKPPFYVQMYRSSCKEQYLFSQSGKPTLTRNYYLATWVLIYIAT